MSEIFRAFGLVFVIFSDDHPPPHVHVGGPGWRMKIVLSDPPDLVSITGRATRPEARRALKLTRENLTRLLEAWENLHERLD